MDVLATHSMLPSRTTSPPTPSPIVYVDESPRTGYRSPFADLPNGFAPSPLATGTPQSFEPVAVGHPGTCPAVPPRCVAAGVVPGFAPALPHPRPPEWTPATGLPTSGQGGGPLATSPTEAARAASP